MGSEDHEDISRQLFFRQEHPTEQNFTSNFNMKTIIALFALIAAAVASDYHQGHYEHSHHYVPTEYYYDVAAYGYYGDHAHTYVSRKPHSVHYDLKEYGPHGSSQYANFEQKFGKGYY